MELGGPELLVILVIVALVFGPSRIGGLARSLGSAVHEFRAGQAGEVSPDEGRSLESENRPGDR